MEYREGFEGINEFESDFSGSSGFESESQIEGDFDSPNLIEENIENIISQMESTNPNALQDFESVVNGLESGQLRFNDAQVQEFWSALASAAIPAVRGIIGRIRNRRRGRSTRVVTPTRTTPTGTRPLGTINLGSRRISVFYNVR